MPLQFKRINVLGKSVKACKFGNPSGIPVLVAGPASIYMESLKLEKFCCLYGIDYYWTKEANVSPKEIASLSTDQLAHDLESYRKALQDSGEFVERIVVLGPSAVGLTAAKYASFYKKHALGVIMLNTPLGLNGLLDAQNEFINSNYNPYNMPGKYISTNNSISFWKTYQNKCKQYNEDEKKVFSDNDEQYMQELLRDEIKYYQNPQAAKEMYEKWPSFNIDMRNHFFKIMQEEETSFLKKVECPVLNTLGVADGIVPFTFVLEEQSEKEPKKYTPYIFKSAHMPPLEDTSFSDVVRQWFNDNNVSLSDDVSQIRSKL